jgi:VWFA-related protein
MTTAGVLVLSTGLAVAVPSGLAQETPSELRRDVFRVDTEVVLLDVVVRDKKGRTVRDLRPEEIQVFEDDARQEVGGFRFLDSRAIGEALEDATDSPAPPARGTAGAPVPALPTPPRPGESRHLNLVTFLFDQLDVDGRHIARQAALHFLELENRPDVYFSVFQVGESLKLVQQFTTDHEVARSAVLRATRELNTQYTAALQKLTEAVDQANALRDQLNSAGQVADASGANAVAQLGQEVAMADMAVNALRMTDTLQREQQGRSVLFAILALARQQQKLAGRKTILFFSEGVQTPPTLEHVLRASISEANRANVSVYGVDVRGLTTTSSLDASRESLRQAADTSMRQQLSRGSRLVTQEEMLLSDTTEATLRMDTVGTLRQLAESTGGMLISNTNDVRRGVAHAVGDLRGYYEVAYSPSNRSFDGRFRRVSLKVTRPGVTVQTRSGYYTLPPGEGTATFPYEVELLQATRVTPRPADFPLRARAFRFGFEGDRRRYTVVLEVPMASLRFSPEKNGGFDAAHFAFMGLVRTSWGAVAEKFSQDVPLFVPRRRVASLRRGNAVFLRSFTLPAGRFRLEAAAMDQQTKQRAVETAALEVPAEPAAVALSSLALIRRTEPVPAGALDSEDPFRVEGTRIVPWVSEPALTAADTLSLFFVAYVDPAAKERASLLLEFVRDGDVVSRVAPVLPAPDEKGRIPYIARLPAAALRPGAYELRAVLVVGERQAEESCRFAVGDAEDASRASRAVGAPPVAP